MRTEYLKQQLRDYNVKVSAVAGIRTRKDVAGMLASVEHVLFMAFITI